MRWVETNLERPGGLIATGGFRPQTNPFIGGQSAREMLRIIDETENVAKYLQIY